MLTTTSLARKYIGVLDAPLTLLLGVLRSVRGKKKKEEEWGEGGRGATADFFCERSVAVGAGAEGDGERKQFKKVSV